MRGAWFSTVVVALVFAGAAPHPRAAGPTPVLVELFTSEGCSDCPPADRLLQTLVDDSPVDGVQVIGLGQHVDYWDRLGWRDRFSSAALTERQRLYSLHFGSDRIYTPQMIVDGRTEFVGSDAGAARRALARATKAPHATLQLNVDLTRRDRAAVGVTADALPPLGRNDRAELVVAVTEDDLRSDVTRGENSGRALTHAAVVRYLEASGTIAAGTPVHVDVPLAPEWRRDRLRIVAFVQANRSRAVLGAAAVPLEHLQR